MPNRRHRNPQPAGLPSEGQLCELAVRPHPLTSLNPELLSFNWANLVMCPPPRGAQAAKACSLSPVNAPSCAVSFQSNTTADLLKKHKTRIWHWFSITHSSLLALRMESRSGLWENSHALWAGARGPGGGAIKRGLIGAHSPGSRAAWAAPAAERPAHDRRPGRRAPHRARVFRGSLPHPK